MDWKKIGRESSNIETAFHEKDPVFGDMERTTASNNLTTRLVPDDLNEKCGPKVGLIFKKASGGFALDLHLADPPSSSPECRTLMEKFSAMARDQGLVVVGKPLNPVAAMFGHETSLMAIPPDSPQARAVAVNTVKPPGL
jgi:hypothetical protein